MPLIDRRTDYVIELGQGYFSRWHAKAYLPRDEENFYYVSGCQTAEDAERQIRRLINQVIASEAKNATD